VGGGGGEGDDGEERGGEMKLVMVEGLEMQAKFLQKSDL